MTSQPYLLREFREFCSSTVFQIVGSIVEVLLYFPAMNSAKKSTSIDETNGHDRPFPWYLGVYDAHCHPTDSMYCVQDISKMRARALTIMATRIQDQDLVSQVADEMGFEEGIPAQEGGSEGKCQVIPSFGWHPWFSHQLYDDLDHSYRMKSKLGHYQSVLTPSPEDGVFISNLPEPKPLSEYLDLTRKRLLRHSLALVGEIGLDKAFRIPESSEPSRLEEVEPGLTPGGREGRHLSRYRVEMSHQRKILKAQLNLAGEMARAVSVHGVAAHGIVFEALQETWKGHEKAVVSRRQQKRRGSVDGAHVHGDREDSEEDLKHGSLEPQPYPPRICLHSYSGPPEALKQYLNPSIPCTVFFSFSQVINFSTPASKKAIEVIKALPQDRILVESDLHCAGQRMDNLLEEMVRSVCDARGWNLEDGAQQLGRNWRQFALGEK